MRFRKFLPHIKSLFLVGVVVFFLALNSHDSGIPDSLTAEQQEYVVTTCVDWNCQMERVIAGLEDFNAHPEDEAGCAKALALEMEALKEIGDKFYLEPAFYAGFELEPKLREKTLRLVNTDLAVTAEKAIAEIMRRRDDPNFEVDQTSYDTVRKALMGFGEIENVERSFCDPGECFWCSLKRGRSARMNFAKQFCKTVGAE